MLEMEAIKYRRKENRLEWHFNEACRKYPERDFIELESGQSVQSTMICPICKRLQAEETQTLDTRQPKEQLGFFDALVVSVFGG